MSAKFVFFMINLIRRNCKRRLRNRCIRWCW
jgi:hypothetical protein